MVHVLEASSAVTHVTLTLGIHQHTICLDSTPAYFLLKHNLHSSSQTLIKWKSLTKASY